ncbi:MAG: hypothetical protein HC916_12620 [Coleofasciculaceae cyanobacterium SM2_1_6]|nr:hypothetical protein [Coleofasciculaceae cyanobacterium SM2_1_6]
MHKTRFETIGIIAAVVAAAATVSQAWTAWQAYQLQEAQQSSTPKFTIYYLCQSLSSCSSRQAKFSGWSKFGK